MRGPVRIENGPTLCVQHHQLFDFGALGLDRNHRILVSEHLNLSERDSSASGCAGPYDAIMSRIDAFALVPTTEGDHSRALALQRQLAERGRHRALSLVDALVAAAAESRNLTVLHYDADFDLGV